MTFGQRYAPKSKHGPIPSPNLGANPYCHLPPIQPNFVPVIGSIACTQNGLSAFQSYPANRYPGAPGDGNVLLAVPAASEPGSQAQHPDHQAYKRPGSARSRASGICYRNHHPIGRPRQNTNCSGRNIIPPGGSRRRAIPHPEGRVFWLAKPENQPGAITPTKLHSSEQKYSRVAASGDATNTQRLAAD